MTQRAADDTAQHIATAFVAGNDTVDDQERAGADVVRDDFQRIVCQVLSAGFACGGLDQVLE